MNFTPENNDGTCIFVFGSNLAGRHGAGAACTAWLFWGARYGAPEGRQGMSYAIPTKDQDLRPLGLPDIQISVKTFLDYATRHLELRFLVTKIGCGLAGNDEADIRPMFKSAPGNCVLPEGWGVSPNCLI